MLAPCSLIRWEKVSLSGRSLGEDRDEGPDKIYSHSEAQRKVSVTPVQGLGDMAGPFPRASALGFIPSPSLSVAFLSVSASLSRRSVSEDGSAREQKTGLTIQAGGQTAIGIPSSRAKRGDLAHQQAVALPRLPRRKAPPKKLPRLLVSF